MSESVLTKKKGPLPVWAWGAVGIVAIYLYYRYSQANSSSSPTSSSAAAVNNGIDPVTGIPLSEEQAAYQNEAASALAPGSGGSTGSGGSSGGSGSSTPDLGQEITDITNLIQSLEGAGLVPPPGTNGTPTPAPAPAPVTGGNPPSAPPSVGSRMSTGTLLNVKAILAPFGSAPPPKTGYTTVGTGNGNWQYVPDSLAPIGGAIVTSISHNAPTAPTGFTTRGLGQGLWAIVPKKTVK